MNHKLLGVIPLSEKFVSNLTADALADINALDDFYDLYVEIQNIYESEQRYRLDELGTPRQTFMFGWDRFVHAKVRNVLEVFLRKYSFLFIDEGTLHANQYGFGNFSILNFQPLKFPDIGFKVTYKTFRAFLSSLQGSINRVVYRWKTQEKPKYPFELVAKEINDHIGQYVREHTAVCVNPTNSYSDIPENTTLYVYKNLASTSCRLNQHTVVPKSYFSHFALESGTLEIPVHYCENCKKAFIGEETLKLYEKKYGKLLIKKRKLDSHDIFSGLRLESILFQYGYNVSDGRSETERQKLLIALLDTRRVSYMEMTRCIEFNIQMHSEHKDAVLKWKKDLKFIGDYVLHQQ